MWLNSRMRQYIKSKKATFKYELVSNRSTKRQEKKKKKRIKPCLVARRNTLRQGKKIMQVTTSKGL